MIETPATEVFRWHERPGALDRLLPPWENVRILHRTGGIHNGDRVELSVRLGPIPLHWRLEHRDYIQGHQFRDVQLSGPFAHWEHVHRFEAEGDGICRMVDEIAYELPMGRPGKVMAGDMVRRRLEKLFAFRHQRTAEDIRSHRAYRDRRRLRVLVSGASGLIGSAVTAFLRTGGHEVRRLTRGPKRDTGDYRWDPTRSWLEEGALEDVDAVVHLAGENLARGRWTKTRKREIWRSRIEGTRLLAEAMAGVERRGRVMVSASAIGFYGTSAQTCSEAAPAGAGFLSELCRHWEAASREAEDAGVRTVQLRFGVVLDPQGGALASMLPAFRSGLGGALGSGRQPVSWISLDDAVEAIHHAMMHEPLRGPINAVAPAPVSNAELVATLGRVLRRPARLRVPGVVLRAMFGQMAEEVLLDGVRVIPERLLDQGFVFRHTDVETALRFMLGSVRAD